ncbi:MBL fold metallo-hydrolase [Streptomyces sp. NPDC004393]
MKKPNNRRKANRMCLAPGTAAEAASATPRPAFGPAVDPIHLEPVDEVEITILVDNVYDALLGGDERTRRAPFSVGAEPAPHFEEGESFVGLVAEHGFSALVTIKRLGHTSSLLFDTGLSPKGMVVNADRLGVRFDDLQAVVLSHGHFDHAGGLAGLAGRRRASTMPMLVHPEVWTRRRVLLPGSGIQPFPTVSKKALRQEGFDVVERRVPSLLLDESVLITGEVDRTTEFERGMPPSHEAWTGERWAHDAKIIDDQALVVNLRGHGLVVLTGCGHAGAVNIVRHALRLTQVDRLHALIGGLHLSGPAFEPIIPPTITALAQFAPSLVVPGHCTGWRAQHALAAALPSAWVPSSSGTSLHLEGAPPDVPAPAPRMCDKGGRSPRSDGRRWTGRKGI